MVLESNGITYEWQDNWAGLNSTESSSHHDLAIDSNGRIYCSFAAEPYLRVFDRDGNLLDAFNLSGSTMHCLFISEDDEGEWLWNVSLADKALTKSTLEGEIVASIGRGDFGVAENEKFDITAGTYDPDTGNVWITDGYGQWREGEFGGRFIYCFDKDLTLKFRLDGSEAPCGAHNEPHWIFADRRKGHTEIYVADRRNHRLVVYDGEGTFLRTVGGDLNTPSGFGVFGDTLVVSELEGRLHLLDANDEIIATFADGSAYVNEKGWPNRKIGDTVESPLNHVEQGRFNSPHGLVADPDGNIYVHEWHKGVRITKLRRK